MITEKNNYLKGILGDSCYMNVIWQKHPIRFESKHFYCVKDVVYDRGVACNNMGEQLFISKA